MVLKVVRGLRSSTVYLCLSSDNDNNGFASCRYWKELNDILNNDPEFKIYTLFSPDDATLDLHLSDILKGFKEAKSTFPLHNIPGLSNDHILKVTYREVEYERKYNKFGILLNGGLPDYSDNYFGYYYDVEKECAFGELFVSFDDTYYFIYREDYSACDPAKYLRKTNQNIVFKKEDRKFHFFKNGVDEGQITNISKEECERKFFNKE